MLGKEKNESVSDPWPVTVPGVTKPISSAKIEEYVNYELHYYYNFYTTCKHSGSPFPSGWLDWPPWVTQLLAEFDDVMDRDRRDNERRFFAVIHGYKVN